MRLIVSGLCASLALAGVAYAQDASSMLSRLHDDLHLTPAQDAAWRQYTTAMGGMTQMQARRQSAQQMLPQLTTPRRIALMDANMAQDLADFHRQSQAVIAFYNSLTPDQQRTFDRDTLPSGGQR